MKIVVFGTGFVGNALIREFADRGHEVTAVSRSGNTDLPTQVAAVAGSALVLPPKGNIPVVLYIVRPFCTTKAAERGMVNGEFCL